jgi:hypothetical protein
VKTTGVLVRHPENESLHLFDRTPTLVYNAPTLMALQCPPWSKGYVGRRTSTPSTGLTWMQPERNR